MENYHTGYATDLSNRDTRDKHGYYENSIKEVARITPFSSKEGSVKRDETQKLFSTTTNSCVPVSSLAPSSQMENEDHAFGYKIKKDSKIREKNMLLLRNGASGRQSKFCNERIVRERPMGEQIQTELVTVEPHSGRKLLHGRARGERLSKEQCSSVEASAERFHSEAILKERDLENVVSEKRLSRGNVSEIRVLEDAGLGKENLREKESKITVCKDSCLEEIPLNGQEYIGKIDNVSFTQKTVMSKQKMRRSSSFEKTFSTNYQIGYSSKIPVVEGKAPSVDLIPNGSKQVGSLSRRAISLERDRESKTSSVERGYHNYKTARNIGKIICVCGASAYWERERTSIIKERQRLKAESERLKSELSKLRANREMVCRRLLDVEEMESQLNGKLESLQEREKSVEEEIVKQNTSWKILKEARNEVEEQRKELIKREKEVEVKQMRTDTAFTKAECQRKKNLVELHRLETYDESLKKLQREISEERENLKKDQDEMKKMQACLSEQKLKAIAKEAELDSLANKITNRENDVHSMELILNEKDMLQKKKQKELEEQAKKNEENFRSLSEKLSQLENEKLCLMKKREELEMYEKEFYESKEKQEKNLKQKLSDYETLIESKNKCLDEEKCSLDERKKKYEEKFLKLEEKEYQVEQENKQLLLRQKEFECREKDYLAKESELKLLNEKLCELEISLKTEKKQYLQKEFELEKEEAKVKIDSKEIDRQKSYYDQLKKEMQLKERDLARKEDELKNKELVLSSKERNSDWHEAVIKEIRDMKESYDLQMQDFELEKRAFEEMRSELVESHKRTSEMLKMREQALAALEAEARQRHREVLRQEVLMCTSRSSQPLEETGGLKNSKLNVSSKKSDRKLKSGDFLFDRTSYTNNRLPKEKMSEMTLPHFPRQPEMRQINLDAKNRKSKTQGLGEPVNLSTQDGSNGIQGRPEKKGNTSKTRNSSVSSSSSRKKKCSKKEKQGPTTDLPFDMKSQNEQITEATTYETSNSEDNYFHLLPANIEEGINVKDMIRNGLNCYNEKKDISPGETHSHGVHAPLFNSTGATEPRINDSKFLCKLNIIMGSENLNSSHFSQRSNYHESPLL